MSLTKFLKIKKEENLVLLFLFPNFLDKFKMKIFISHSVLPLQNQVGNYLKVEMKRTLNFINLIIFTFLY